MIETVLAQFSRLMESRELALLNLVGVVEHAIGNLNLNDPPAALHTLLNGLELYVRADEHITEFHKHSARPAAKEAA